MGSFTDSFSNLSDLLLAERAKAEAEHRRHSGADLLCHRLFEPLLPRSMRCGPGLITDRKDRRVGPLDLIGCTDRYPALGEGPTTLYLADGVAFCLQVRNWTVEALTLFGQDAGHLKALERKRPELLPCFAVSYEPLSLHQISEFLNSRAGQSVDGILTIGHHVMVRNNGFYGSVSTIPFVTERSGPEALKAFSLLLLRLSHDLLDLPFGVGDYQHL